MEKGREKEQRIWLDAAKGIAILFVVLADCMGGKSIWNYFIAGCVPMFYILEGYTMKEDTFLEEDVPGKIRNWLYPYFVSSFLLVFITMLLDILAGIFSAKEMLLGVAGIFYSRLCLFPLNSSENYYFLFCYNSPLWLLTSLFLSFIIAKIYLGAGKRMKRYLFVSFLIVILCLEVCPILLPWSFDTAFLAALFMILGKRMSRKDWESVSKTKLGVMILLLLVVSVLLVKLNGESDMSVHIYGKWGCLSLVLFFAIGSCCTLLCFLLCKWMEKTVVARGLATLGNNTIVILCSHLLIYRICRRGMELLGGNQWNETLLSLTGCILTLLVSLAIAYVLGKTPKKKESDVSTNLQ